VVVEHDKTQCQRGKAMRRLVSKYEIGPAGACPAVRTYLIPRARNLLVRSIAQAIRLALTKVINHLFLPYLTIQIPHLFAHGA
jgi:hypothetical protein